MMIEESTYENPHNFEQAKQWLAENPGRYDYEVRIDGHTGALMTRETWLEAVADRSFIDYDGMGDEIDEHGNIVGKSPGTAFPDPGWIYPSAASRIRPETRYILWYNK
jgi:hypothetical protein